MELPKLPKIDFLDFSSLFGASDLMGMDIGSYSVKVVHMRGSPGNWTLVRWSILPLPVEAVSQEIDPNEKKLAISTAIKNYLSIENITVKNVVISVSGSSVIVRYVKFPRIAKEELAKSIQFEAEPYIPFDIKEVTLGFYVLGEVTEEGQKKTDTVLVAAKKDLIQSKIDILRDAGLTPVIIDVDAFALESSYEINRDPQTSEMVLVANMGANVTNITILENGTSRVVRDIFIGGIGFTKAIQKSLQCDYSTAEALKKKYGILITAEDKEQALKNEERDALQISNILTPMARDLLAEIHRSIDFFYSQRGEQQVINKVLLSGGGSGLKNLDKYLSQELKMPVEFFNPFQKVNKTTEIPADQAHQMAIAVGLASRRLKEK